MGLNFDRGAVTATDGRSFCGDSLQRPLQICTGTSCAAQLCKSPSLCTLCCVVYFYILSLIPSVLKQCVCMLSWKLLECVWGRQRERARRDIYSEMLDESHACPLSQVRAVPSRVALGTPSRAVPCLMFKLKGVAVCSQYSINSSAPRHISVAELSQSLLSDCWAVSLSSLLPPGGPGLTSAEINSALSWSCKTVSSDPAEGGSPG